jgi:hypothetical protein
VKTHTLPAVALNLLAVDGTTIKFAALSWVVRSQGQDTHNQTRKALVSTIPKIKICVLLGRCLAGTQILATWAVAVVPISISLIGSHMSLDMLVGLTPRRPRGRTCPGS